MAYCETGGIDPRHYLTSIIESLGYWCDKNNVPLQPSHIKGAGAVDRYNRWLERNQAQSASADATFSPKTDTRLHAELAYVELYAAVLATGDSCRARKIAKQAANEVHEGYARCAFRRVIALSDYLHRLHPMLPDVLVLGRGWTTKEVLSVSFKLVNVGTA